MELEDEAVFPRAPLAGLAQERDNEISHVVCLNHPQVAALSRAFRCEPNDQEEYQATAGLDQHDSPPAAGTRSRPWNTADVPGNREKRRPVRTATVVVGPATASAPGRGRGPRSDPLLSP